MGQQAASSVQEVLLEPPSGAEPHSLAQLWLRHVVALLSSVWQDWLIEPEQLSRHDASPLEQAQVHVMYPEQADSKAATWLEQ